MGTFSLLKKPVGEPPRPLDGVGEDWEARLGEEQGPPFVILQYGKKVQNRGLGDGSHLVQGQRSC